MNFISANLSIFIAIGFYLIIHFYNKRIHQLIRWIILDSLLVVSLTIFIEIPIVSDVIDSGHLSLAFFLLVMFAGVLPKKSVFYKKILLVRGDLAILGFIFLLPHGIERLSLALSGYNASGLIAMIIMIPLTLSSFMTIRKKIRPDRWKKLHKFAYIAYFMIYLHLGFDISINPSNVYIVFSAYSILYHLLFLIYLVMKTHLIWKKRQFKK